MTKQTSRQSHLVKTKKVYLKEKYVVIEYCGIRFSKINTSGHKGQERLSIIGEVTLVSHSHL